jgi:HD-GYP domain-containing protein (c-di-GMP phosphodiesterase class II)
MKLVFHDVVCSLTSALDLVGVTEVYHGKRVAIMAANVAKVLGWSNEQQLDLLYAGMLHDCGVSTTTEHTKLVSELEWRDAYAHCERGSRYLNDCLPFAKYATWILHHHDHWTALQGTDLNEFDKLATNLIFLVDRVDFLQAKYVGFEKFDSNILLKKQKIVDEIQQYKGTYFSDVLMEGFLNAAEKESFWLSMDPYYINTSIQTYSIFSPQETLTFSLIRNIAELFSKVIDAKSPFTEQHSKYVAIVARFLAEKLGFDEDELEEIEIAGMLHDLGKLRVPDDILNKNSPLTEQEHAHIVRHSFDTQQLLKAIFPNTRIANWAAYHHESLNGHGYPFRLNAGELDLGARIVAVADVFQALVQKRPYRNTLTPDEIKPIMDAMVVNGKLDIDVLEVLNRYKDECYQLASA